jgi:hypothetical protein
MMKLSEGTRCRGRNSESAPVEYKYRALLRGLHRCAHVVSVSHLDLLYVIKYCNDVSSGVVCLSSDKEYFPVGSEESNTLYRKIFPRIIS